MHATEQIFITNNCKHQAFYSRTYKKKKYKYSSAAFTSANTNAIYRSQQKKKKICVGSTLQATEVIRPNVLAPLDVSYAKIVLLEPEAPTHHTSIGMSGTIDVKQGLVICFQHKGPPV